MLTLIMLNIQRLIHGHCHDTRHISLVSPYLLKGKYVVLGRYTVKPCLKWPLKNKTKIGFQDRLLLNVGQKVCRMLSAIHSTFIKLESVTKIFVLSIFELLLKTGFTVPGNVKVAMF